MIPDPSHLSSQSRSLIAVLLAALSSLVIPATGFSASPSAYVREIIEREAPGQVNASVRCVTSSELARQADRSAVGTALSGVTITQRGRRARILLSYSRVCKPIARYRLTGKLYGTTALAILTVLHEAAHARGIRVEWKATCAAIPGTLRMLRRWGADRYQLRRANRFLRVGAEKYRLGEYKLRGRC
ncbi:MAG TPA: hypothetical protein VFR38_12905 [Gaiellaceae bacterium]|nr:hypothetical protein [Gaiellaceae bacterium]